MFVSLTRSDEDAEEESAAAAAARPPGSIDNRFLLRSAVPHASGLLMLRDDARESNDFVLVSALAWRHLVSWYGGGPCIERFVIAAGVRGVRAVELWPHVVTCALVQRAEALASAPTRALVLSRTASLAALHAAVCAAWETELHTDAAGQPVVRVWRADQAASGARSYAQLWPPPAVSAFAGTPDEALSAESSLEDAEFQEEQTVLVETCAAEADAWPLAALVGSATHLAPGSELANATNTSAQAAGASAATSGRAGRCGLANLGNTCFLNAVVQCLSHVPRLRAYLLSASAASEVNPANPLGSRGELMRATVGLVARLWLGREPYVAPTQLKRALGKHAPHFVGYAQQDAHELLLFLVDALHEDVNGAGGRTQAQAAQALPELGAAGAETIARLGEAAWAAHAARNDSAIARLFGGQLRSTIVCSACERVSTTFDPAFALSLPIPQQGLRLRVTFWPLEPGAPVQVMAFRLGFEADASELRACVAAASGVPPACLVLARVENSRIVSTLGNSSLLAKLPRSAAVSAYQVSSDTRFAAKAMHRFYMRKVCALCGQDGCTARCKACKLQYYCSREHQVAHWAWHKPRCGRELPQARMVIGGEPVLVPRSVRAVSGAELYASIWRLLEGRVCAARDSAAAADSGAQVDASAERAYPFLLRLVSSTGRECSRCEPDAGCSGCIVPAAADGQALDVGLAKTDCLAIDWHDEDARERCYAPRTPTPHSSLALVPPVRIEDCLAQFCATEQLDSANAWHCRACDKHVCASKTLVPWRLPVVLVVHLKRFRRSGLGGALSAKLDDDVQFDEFLSVREPVREESASAESGEAAGGGAATVVARYRLLGLVLHSGSLHGGHYTALARNGDDWLLFDDATVRTVPLARVLAAQSAAYLLFYERGAV